MKLKCKCGNIANWLYMPGNDDKDDAYCDECVPRGCHCNTFNVENFSFPTGQEGIDWRWIDKESGDIEDLDNGRQIPCCEYSYNKEGWDAE